MDTRLSSAIHILIMIAGAERQLKQTTLADCMDKMRVRIGEEQ